VKPLVSHPSGALRGEARPPGDKSISHRALMIGSSAVGATVIRGLLEADDVMATAAALRRLGATIQRGSDGTWRVDGCGVGGLTEPDRVLDMGNSGTGARLLMGLLATHPMTAFMTGDASLRSRPMARVIEPLTEMGARVVARGGERLPLAVVGTSDPVPIEYRMRIASAQVKSAILLAALNAPGITTVIEDRPSRDHSERMLRSFGAEVTVEETAGGGRRIALVGQPELTGSSVTVPADPSAAAFAAVAAAITPGSQITMREIGVNPLRAGLYRTLEDMGAEIRLTDQRDVNGEPVADIVVRAAALTGIEVPAERAPAMIDEYPVLAVAAASAKGTTVLNGIGELRVKESDRLAAVARGLERCGVSVKEGADSLIVHGCDGPPPGPADAAPPVETHMDHRIAMAFLVLGAAAQRPVAVDDGSMIATSFPGFADFMNGLGADIRAPAAP